MLPAPLAIAWPIWRRHRWGLIGVAVFLACSAGVAWAFTELWATHAGNVRDDFRQNALESILFPTIMVLAFVFMFLIGVFSYGFDADLSARESCFPPSLFRLPVGTAALVGWPMLYGAAAAALLWLATAVLVLQPWLGRRMPLWWPAALAMASMAWFQALLWAPMGLKVIRIILAVLMVPGLVAVAGYCEAYEKSTGFRVGAFMGLATSAWAVGYCGVRYARRGDIPSWRILPQLRLALRKPGERAFGSMGSAQLWFEFKRNGYVLPGCICVLVPFCCLGLLFPKEYGTSAATSLVVAMAVPVVLAGLSATIVSGKHAWVKDYYGISPFAGTLPLSTSQLVGAKLKAAALSTLITWLLVAIMMIVALLATRRLSEAMDRLPTGLIPKSALECLLGFLAPALAMIVWTWKRLVGSLVLGLTGRKWFINTCLSVNMVGFWIFCGVSTTIHQPGGELYSTLKAIFPWFLVLWAFCRFAAASWAVWLVLRINLVQTRTVICWAAAWLLVAGVLFCLLSWAVPPKEIERQYLPFVVLLVMPMVELAAAPLALAWNRHR